MENVNMDASEDRLLRMAVDWVAPVRDDPLTAAVICINLDRLPECDSDGRRSSNRIQLDFMQVRSAVIGAIVNEHRSPSEAAEIAALSEFHDFINVVAEWEGVIETLARAFRDRNNGSDRTGKQMWVAPGILAVNLWREFS